VAAFDFSPIRGDLALVEDQLSAVSVVDFRPLAAILRNLLQSGGKRLRPALVILSAHFYESDPHIRASVAAALEILHTATLVHDDLIDNSLLRRGNPTLNTTWNSGVVVLVGDYLFGKSAELAARAQDTDLAEVFARTVTVICDGELRNMLDGQRWNPTLETYNQRIYAKTASLFATCCEAGAILGHAPRQQRELLRECGRTLGMAFQIADDILDFVGDEQTMGKPVGSDLRQGTVTLPAICFLRSHPQVPAVRRLAGGDTSAPLVSELIDLIRTSDAIDESYLIARDFARQAKDTLSALPDASSRQVLCDLADFVVERKT
jgi:geranylgeranyl pyrophosphate synthase